MSGEERAEALKKAEGEFLQSLIVRSLQLQEAKKAKIAATPKDVDAAIEDIRLKYGMDEQVFREAIRSEGLEWDSYREMLWEQISLRRIVDKEVRAKLPDALDVDGSLLYSVGLVVFKQNGEDDDPLARAGKFLEEVGSGASFEDLAQEYTSAPAAQLAIKEDQVSEPFRVALKGMEPGDVSRPFIAGSGVNVLKLYERMAPEELEFERLFEERYRNWMKELLDNSYVDVRL
jgi:peptidyl-prolyl cis-trans isomerase SurA